MRGLLQRIDEGLPAPLARETAKFVRADDHDFFTAVDGHVLWPFLFRASHDFAEPGFCLLQLPLRRPSPAWPLLSCCGRWSLSQTGHTDQITTCGQKSAVAMDSAKVLDQHQVAAAAVLLREQDAAPVGRERQAWPDWM